MKKILFGLCFISFINALVASDISEDLSSSEGIRSFLSQKKAVSNRGGNTYDCSGENPDKVLSSVNLSLQQGASTFLEREILEHNPKAEALPFARSFASLLRKGKPLEEITAKEVGARGSKDLNHLKNALNLTINHFCWENGVTTEVTQEEVTSLLVLRYRLINYKKNLSM